MSRAEFKITRSPRRVLQKAPTCIIVRRNKDLKESLAKERKAANSAGFIHPTDQRYGERTVVERVNGRLKDLWSAPMPCGCADIESLCTLDVRVLALCVDQIVHC